jgi:hypothetical protein
VMPEQNPLVRSARKSRPLFRPLGRRRRFGFSSKHLVRD